MATTCAPRFTLTLPVRYRPAGEPAWRMATTRNLSSSGVLFRTHEMLRPGAEVQVEIDLDETYPGHATKVTGTGKVVRQLRDESGRDTWFVAIKYDYYHVERPEQPKFPAPLPARTPFAPKPSHV
jgi:hypothetical protein